eukprot:764421-Hanusia_phi.AAC.4
MRSLQQRRLKDQQRLRALSVRALSSPLLPHSRCSQLLRECRRTPERESEAYALAPHPLLTMFLI